MVKGYRLLVTEMKMKEMIYITPEMKVVRVREDIVCTSMPTAIHNEYKEGDGLAPEKRTIW